jgi:hypothetical protein
MGDFRVGDFLPSVNWNPDFLGKNIQLFQRIALKHPWPTYLFTHLNVIDGLTPSMVSVVDQTAPHARHRWMDRDTLRHNLTKEKPAFSLYRPTFLIGPHGKAALQGYVDGRIARKAPYDAQQLPMYWRNWYAHEYEGLPNGDHIFKWWIFKDHPIDDTCSSFGAGALRAIMDAENEDFSQAFGGIHMAEVTPSHFGNSKVLQRVVLERGLR